MVDSDRVTRLLGAIDRDAGFLDTFGSSDPNDVLANATSLAAIKYGFITATKGCARVAHHICASEGWKVGETSADSIQMLSERGVISSDLAESLSRASGFRNVLVHQYIDNIDIDDVRAVENLNRIGDFRTFVASVSAWIDRIET